MYPFIRRLLLLSAMAALVAGRLPVVVAGSTPQNTDRLQPDRLVTEVLEANRGLAALEASVREAAARQDQAGRLDDPDLAWDSAPRTYRQDIGQGQNLRVSQRIPWPGALDRREEQAAHQRKAQQYRLEAARLEVEALTRTAWAEWFFLHQALRINEENLDVLQDLRSSVETRYAAGEARQQDVLRVEQERIRLQHQRIGYQRQQRSVRAQINALLNRPADAALAPPADEVSLRPLPALQPSAVEDHPELRRRRSQLAASDTEVELARLDFFPDLQLRTGYNSLWPDADKRWTVGISINIPLDQHKRHAAVDEARAGRMRRQWRLEEEQRQLQSGLTSAHAAAEESLHLVELYRDRLLPLARETLNASLADFRSGAGGFLNVIDAEQGRLRSEVALIRARTDYLRHMAELKHRAGGELPAASVSGGQNDE